MPDLDPRQELFASLYTDPTSPTFSNAYQSGLKAGFSDEYSKTLTSDGQNTWFSEILGDMKRLKKAEENLDMFLDYGDDPKIQADITNDEMHRRQEEAELYTNDIDLIESGDNYFYED